MFVGKENQENMFQLITTLRKFIFQNLHTETELKVNRVSILTLPRQKEIAFKLNFHRIFYLNSSFDRKHLSEKRPMNY